MEFFNVPPLEEAVRHEQVISVAGRSKLDYAERDKCKPVLLRLSLARNLEKPVMSLYGTGWKERGYGLRIKSKKTFNVADGKESLSSLANRLEPVFTSQSRECKGFWLPELEGQKTMSCRLYTSLL
jgi:hypothetical protein